ncbi:unnamed protein product [Bursaphelenchus okinawaensis]|uniref:FZ domain-containing protein n=1 Tax=Bursaphelenchus okinawaensis TaxID=465554 RepID=A0A811KR80_9BILA|nr:unnamed protein product [Bursaphelenchus okinawaensis]CAG9109581.1 unnamed protein product [Bursaphelenchus okinawaensis]
MNLLLILLISSLTIASSTVDGDDEEEDVLDEITDPIKLKQFEKYTQCADKDFKCMRKCHVMVDVTGSCNQFKRTSCFDLIVNYNHTLRSTPFPSYLIGLKRFPKCWSVLEPVICSIWYRNCSTVEVNHLTDNTKPRLKLESFELLSRQSCIDVRTQCANFTHLLPEEFNCDSHLFKDFKNFGLYHTECERKPKFVRSLTAEPSRCIKPLVLSTGANVTSPLIDQCYLPCRTSYFDAGQGFYHFVCGYTITVALLASGLMLTIYLKAKSCALPIWAFVLMGLGFCTMVYYAIWSISLLLVYFEQTTVCDSDDDGLLLRLGSFPVLSLCTVQRLTLHLFLSQSFILMFILSYYLLLDRKLNKISKSTNQTIVLVVISVSICLVFISSLWKNHQYADPYYGVCHPGMDLILSGVFVYAFALIASILLLVWHLYVEKKKKKEQEKKERALMDLNMGGIHINLSFPNLGTSLLVFLGGLLTYATKSSTTHDEVRSVRGSIQCYTSSIQAMERWAWGNSTSECDQYLLDSNPFQAVWVFVRMLLLPIIPTLLIVIYIFLPKQRDLFKIEPKLPNEIEMHEIMPLKQQDPGNEQARNSIGNEDPEAQHLIPESDSTEPESIHESNDEQISKKRVTKPKKKRFKPESQFKDGIDSSATDVSYAYGRKDPTIPLQVRDQLLKANGVNKIEEPVYPVQNPDGTVLLIPLHVAYSQMQGLYGEGAVGHNQMVQGINQGQHHEHQGLVNGQNLGMMSQNPQIHELQKNLASTPKMDQFSHGNGLQTYNQPGTIGVQTIDYSQTGPSGLQTYNQPGASGLQTINCQLGPSRLESYNQPGPSGLQTINYQPGPSGLQTYNHSDPSGLQNPATTKPQSQNVEGDSDEDSLSDISSGNSSDRDSNDFKSDDSNPLEKEIIIARALEYMERKKSERKTDG